MSGNRTGTALSRLASNEFRNVIGHFASGVTIITALHEGRRYGTTASAVSSLSVEPPMLLICMNKSSTTGRAIAASRQFAVNILREDQSNAAIQFATKGDDKFAGLKVVSGRRGLPLLEEALASCECRVVEDVAGGTHWVFLAEVDHATARPGAPLAYFRGKFGRLELAEDDLAYRAIRTRVVNRDLPIGEVLDLDLLAEETDVPYASVYHALLKLIGEGLVRRDSEGGLVVVPLTREALEDGILARCAIGLGVAQLTVGKLSDKELAALRTVVEQSRPAPAESFDLSAHFPLYRAVVEHLVGLVGSRALLDAFLRADALAMISSLTAAKAGERHAGRQAALDTYEYHLSLLEAYAKGDREMACQRIERYARRAITLAGRYLEAGGAQL